MKAKPDKLDTVAAAVVLNDAAFERADGGVGRARLQDVVGACRQGRRRAGTIVVSQIQGQHACKERSRQLGLGGNQRPQQAQRYGGGGKGEPGQHER
jgi:hypothetical protein